MSGNREEEIRESLNANLKKLIITLRELEIKEFMGLWGNKRRLIYTNFIAGLARGLGMAVGFTVLGALFLYFLKQLVLLNLPLISDFIAQIVQLVNQSLQR